YTTRFRSRLGNLSGLSEKMAGKIGNVMNGKIIIGNKYDQMQSRSVKNGKEFSDSTQYRISNEDEKRK
ncbi:hypothetical protein M9Y09_18180, partial [Clostridioides difficile]